MFISKMRQLIRDYVIFCSVCQFFKFSKQLFYGQLQPIPISSKSFSELNLNFIVNLPQISSNWNVIMTITNRFSKYVKIVSGRKTMSTEKWKSFYWKTVFKNWKTFSKFISDKNSKFTSNFWKTVFHQCEISFEMTTVYHSFVDGQTERSNQIIETALRCLLINKYEKNWKNMLLHVKYSLNVFENAFIDVSPFEVFYDVKSKNPLMNIVRRKVSTDEMDFLEQKRQIKIDTIDVIKMIQIKMSILFDKKHRPSNLKGKVYLKLTKTKHVKYHVSGSSFLTIKKLGSFNIKKKMNDLAYELNFFSSMKIHSVISVVHLKQIKYDEFDRNVFTSEPRPIMINDHEKYVVKKIVRAKIKNETPNYVMKWKKYKNTIFESKNQLMKNVFDMMKKFNSRKRFRVWFI